MYRSYENPEMLETTLLAAKKRYEKFLSKNRHILHSLHPNADALWEKACDLHQDICALEERLNFAWQDAAHDAETSEPSTEERGLCA